MKILLVEQFNEANQYIEELHSAYQGQGHEVILGVQNFLFSDFVPDMVHIQWPEAIYKWRWSLKKSEESLQLISQRLAFFKERGATIVYTIHNLLPHSDVADFDESCYKLFSINAEVVVHHGAATVERLRQEFPFAETATHVIAPHGPYPFTPGDKVSLRRKYGLPAGKKIFLNFGRMRKNKGLDFADEVFRGWAKGENILFSIGPKKRSFSARVVSKLFQKLKLKNAKASGSKFHLRTYKEISHSEIADIYSVADAAFLAHLDGLNSGILSLAISSGLPVVYPDLGNFEDQTKGWPFARKYKAGDKMSAIAALKEIGTMLEDSSDRSNQEWLKENAWSKHVQIVVSAVEQKRKEN